MDTIVRAGRRHYAILAPPTPGHINPLQALGGELIALGHRITIVHQADVAPLVQGTGIGFAPMASAIEGAHSIARYNAVLAGADRPAGLVRMIRATAAMSRRLLDDAPAVLTAIGADAVIADSAEPAGALLARALRLPYAISVTGLPLLGEAGIPPPYLGWRFRADAIGRFRNRGGYMVANRLMRPVTGMLDAYRQSRGMPQDDRDQPLYVAQCPPALDYPRRRLPPNFHHCGPWRMPPGPRIALPDDGRPLVFCSLGTLQGSRRALFATIAAACAAAGARAVIGHGGGLSPTEAAALPGDPLVRAFWPQEAVLRHCVAAILHGGFNTILDTLAAGVPIVALPIAFEQPGTAARLAWIGAGEVLSPRAISTRRLAATLRRVVSDPGYRRAAARLSGQMQALGGAAAAAARIDAAIG